MTSKVGLTGLYQTPCTRDDYTSVYMIADEDSSSLFVFILFPGCYYDVYEVAYLTEYTKIFLIPISFGPAYVSDIFRLVNDLAPIKEMVKVMYPESTMVPGANTLFLNSFVRGDSKTSYVYSNHGFITFDWKNDNPIDNKHDIYCTFGDKRILLTAMYVDIDRIKYLFDNDMVDYVYVPWQSPAYSIENFNNFVTVMSYLSTEPYGKKIIPYGFGNIEAVHYCQEMFPDNMPVTVRHLFENERPVGGDEIKMTWGETWGEPHNPEPEPPHCPLECRPPKRPPMPAEKRPGWIPCPPPPPGEPFWQGPAYPIPPKCECDYCKKKDDTVDNDYKNPSALEIAVNELIASCPNFEGWIKNCDKGCDPCPVKEYVGTTDETTSTDPSENPDQPGTKDDGDQSSSGSETGDNTQTTDPTESTDKDTGNSDKSDTTGSTESSGETDNTESAGTKDTPQTPETTDSGNTEDTSDSSASSLLT